MSLQSQPVSDRILWYPVKAPVQTSTQLPEWQWWWDAGEKVRPGWGGWKYRKGSEWKDGDTSVTQTFLLFSLTVPPSCSMYGERTCLYFVSVLFLSLDLIGKKKKKRKSSRCNGKMK